MHYPGVYFRKGQKIQFPPMLSGVISCPPYPYDTIHHLSKGKNVFARNLARSPSVYKRFPRKELDGTAFTKCLGEALAISLAPLDTREFLAIFLFFFLVCSSSGPASKYVVFQNKSLQLQG